MYVIMLEAENKGLRGNINLVGGAKIGSTSIVFVGKPLSIAIQRTEHL